MIAKWRKRLLRESDHGCDNSSMSMNYTGSRAHPPMWKTWELPMCFMKDLSVIRAEAVSWRGENRERIIRGKANQGHGTQGQCCPLSPCTLTRIWWYCWQHTYAHWKGEKQPRRQRAGLALGLGVLRSNTISQNINIRRGHFIIMAEQTKTWTFQTTETTKISPFPGCDEWPLFLHK